MRTLLPLTLVLAACSRPPSAPFICASDAECDSGQLCFAEGCGDPGRNIIVEVSGGLNGQPARDLPQETLGALTDLSLGAALSVRGELQRERSASNPMDLTAYNESVLVRAVGQSALLPGITRTYEQRFVSPERGTFEMKVGQGKFSITATPADRTVPPVTKILEVLPTVSSFLTFVFPAIDGAPALTGQLIKTTDSTLLPPEPVLLSTEYQLKGQVMPAVDLQLFDLQNNPLSQRFPVASTSGEFAITMSPEARTQTNLVLVAGPREPGVAIPTKRFMLANQGTTAVALEYGDFGEAADVQGTILDSTGTPIVGAQVVLDGTVVGDGTFRSKIVETNSTGDFTVSTLGSKSDGSFTLTVVPPKSSRAAYSQRNVTVRVTKSTATTPALGTLLPMTFTLEDRLIAQGSVNRPGEEKPAVGVFVRATLQVEPRTGAFDEARALPVEPADAITGEDGTFELRLDPGIWRFEYTPGELLPISSRLVTIKPTLDSSGRKLPTQTLSPVELSFGRTVSGTVTGELASPIPFSQLRFFRVTTVEGRPASILLGTSIADDRGKYRVVLPTIAPASK